jgi:hypothetical protein
MEKNIDKKRLKLIARIWTGSMLVSLDKAFDPTGLSQDDEYYIVEFAIKEGKKILRGLPSMTNLNDIVETVKSIEP